MIKTIRLENIFIYAKLARLDFLHLRAIRNTENFSLYFLHVKSALFVYVLQSRAQTKRT